MYSLGDIKNKTKNKLNTFKKLIYSGGCKNFCHIILQEITFFLSSIAIFTSKA